MKKTIGLFLISGLAAIGLASCAKFDFRRVTQVPGGETGHAGYGTNSFQNYTQRVEVATAGTNGLPVKLIAPDEPLTIQATNSFSLQLAATNDIPVRLKAPTNSWSIQVTNPINVQLNQTGAIQANLTISNTPLRFENTNMVVSIGLKFDPALNQLLSNSFKVTVDSAGIEKVFQHEIVYRRIITDTNLNQINSFKSLIGEGVSSSKDFPFWMSIICIVFGGMIGRTIGVKREVEGVYEKYDNIALATLFVIILAEIYFSVWVCYSVARKTEGHSDLISCSAILTCFSPFLFYYTRKRFYDKKVSVCRARNKPDKIFNILSELFLGMLAALLVPAFARIASSTPLALSYEDPLSSIAFFAFCILAGMLGKKFITGLADISEGLLRRVSGDVKKLEDELRQTKEELANCKAMKREGSNHTSRQMTALIKKQNDSLQQIPQAIAEIKSEVENATNKIVEAINPPRQNKLDKPDLSHPES